MKVALTGSSSTGKTTLAIELLKDSFVAEHISPHLEERSRDLLRTMGHRSMDHMTRLETRAFQLAYIEAKEQREAGLTQFLVDRSFVDAAAYWIERDDPFDEMGLMTAVLDRCRRASLGYDGHIYCPFGIIPFVGDGYRSEDRTLHERIDLRIQAFLNEWGIRHLSLTSAVIKNRLDTVLDWITTL